MAEAPPGRCNAKVHRDCSLKSAPEVHRRGRTATSHTAASSEGGGRGRPRAFLSTMPSLLRRWAG
eukprot:9908860-Alexandrium_andersonii.AAC.1